MKSEMQVHNLSDKESHILISNQYYLWKGYVSHYPLKSTEDLESYIAYKMIADYLYIQSLFNNALGIFWRPRFVFVFAFLFFLF